MVSVTCKKTLLAWVLIVIGVILSDRLGLLFSFICLSCAYMLRGANNALVIEEIKNMILLKIIVGVHLIIILMVGLMAPEYFYDLTPLNFILLAAASLLIAAICSDVRNCGRRND